MLAGEVKRTHTRSTGRCIVLLDTRKGGDWIASEDEGGRWITFCDDHGQFLQHTTRRVAEDWMAYPECWCDVCESAVTTVTVDD